MYVHILHEKEKAEGQEKPRLKSVAEAVQSEARSPGVMSSNRQTFRAICSVCTEVPASFHPVAHHTLIVHIFFSRRHVSFVIVVNTRPLHTSMVKWLIWE